MSESTLPVIVALGAVVCWVLAFQRFARFVYTIDQAGVHLRWYVAKFIRVSRQDIPLGQISCARVVPPVRRLAGGFHLFGDLFAGRGVALRLRTRMLRYSFTKVVYVTPDNPEGFVAELQEQLAQTCHRGPTAERTTV